MQRFKNTNRILLRIFACASAWLCLCFSTPAFADFKITLDCATNGGTCGEYDESTVDTIGVRSSDGAPFVDIFGSYYVMTTTTRPLPALPGRRAYVFKGFYSSALNGTQYIDANGYITSAGLSAIAAASPNNVPTWYAQYAECVVGWCPSRYTCMVRDVIDNRCSYSVSDIRSGATHYEYGSPGQVSRNLSANSSAESRITVDYDGNVSEDVSQYPAWYTNPKGSAIYKLLNLSTAITNLGHNSNIISGFIDDRHTQYMDGTGILPETYDLPQSLEAQWNTCTCKVGTGVSACSVSGVTTENRCQYKVTCANGYKDVENQIGEIGVSSYTATCAPGQLQLILNQNYTGAPASTTIYEIYNTKFIDYSESTITSVAVPTRSGYIFMGYFDAQSGGNKIIDSKGNIIAANTTFTGGTTLYAHWEQEKFAINITTTSEIRNYNFAILATGTFVVDCGDGGTLTSDPANSPYMSDNTLTFSSVQSGYTYRCLYSTDGSRTIRFGGLATGYSSSSSTIKFHGGVAYATEPMTQSVSGDLSAIFPILSANSYPKFIDTFHGAANLTTVPATLFQGITVAKPDMFWGTFGDSGLTGVPAGLFGNITGSAENLFRETFFGCTSLTSIPAGLFAGINGSAASMFSSTFFQCSSLSGTIPATAFSGLINNGHPTTTNMWAYAFDDTQLATSCSSGTQYLTGYEGTDTTNYTKWNGKVACGDTVTLNKNASAATAGTATIGAVNGLVMMPIATLPTRPGYVLDGFYDSSAATGGTKYYNADGTSAHIWDKTGAQTLYARWTQCAAGNYCPGDNTQIACPTAATHVRTTFPENYYNPTLYSVTQNTLAGKSAITDCRVQYRFDNARGRFGVDYTYYNPTTQEYDTNPNNIYYIKVNPGYYGDTKLYSDTSCNENTTQTRYQLYQNSLPCPSGSYCPGFQTGAAILCSVGGYEDTKGLNTCPTNYPNSAPNNSSQNNCYVTLTVGQGVATAGGGAANCAANSYNDDTSNIYYGGTHSSEHPTTSTCSACSTLGGGLYNKSVAGSGSTGCYADVAGGKYIENNTDTAVTTCPAYKYCTAQTLYYPNVNTPSDCPTYDSTTRLTTWPSEWAGTEFANPTYSSGVLVNSTGRSTITQCRASYALQNERGTFRYYGVYYNPTTGKYDNPGTTAAMWWQRFNPGYYGSGRYYDGVANCSSTDSTHRMYYQHALECPAGSYCPGSNLVPYCNTGTYNETFAINDCPTNYPNSAAGNGSQDNCYLTTTAGNNVETAGAGQTTCAAGGYCPGGVDIYYGGTSSAQHPTTGGFTGCSVGKYNASTGASAESACTACANGTYQDQTSQTSCTSCPTPSTHKRTTFNDATYTYGGQTYTVTYAGTPTIINQLSVTSYGARDSIDKCTVGEFIQTSTGVAYELDLYNPTTEQYDTLKTFNGWIGAQPGYYLTNKGAAPAGCATYAYYGTVSPCPAGSYCPGVTYSGNPRCDSDPTTYWPTNKGLNSCPTSYTSTAGDNSSQEKCYLAVAAGNVRSGTSGTTLTQCTAGTAKAAHNEYYGTQYSCDSCTGATYSDSAGASSCTTCPTATQYASIVGSYSYYKTGGVHDSVTGCRAVFNENDASGDYNVSCSYSPDSSDYGNSGTNNANAQYCMAGHVTSCAAGKYAPFNNAATANVLWAPTLAGITGNVCVDAGADYWSAAGDITRTACVNAPSNASYTGTGASTSACPYACDGGYYSADNGATCTSVGIGYFSPAASNIRTACPLEYQNTLTANSTSASDCKCGAGYYHTTHGCSTDGGVGCCVATGDGYFSGIDNTRYSCATELNDSAFTHSSSPRGTSADCYRDCTTADVANSYSVSGTYHSAQNNTCAPTSCVSGYYLDNGACTQMTYSGWICPDGTTDISDCYTDVILNKNGGTGTVNGTPGTQNASVRCYYGIDCIWGSTSGLTQTGYTFQNGYWYEILPGLGTIRARGTHGSLLGGVNDFEFFATKQPNMSGAISIDSKYYASSDAATGTVISDGTRPDTVYSQYGVGLSDDGENFDLREIRFSKPYLRGTYDFGGVYTDKAGTGTQIISSRGTILPAASTQVSESGGTATWYVNWQPHEYRVNYYCDSSDSSTPDLVESAYYNSSFTPSNNICVAPRGKMFASWRVSLPRESIPSGVPFIYDRTSDLNLEPVWEDALFTVTVAANASSYGFNLSASGNFIVDCGTDGVLSGPGVTGNYISRNGTTYDVYRCTYPSAGNANEERTIKFGGLATGYGSSRVIGFYDTMNSNMYAYIKSVSGDLSEIFPILNGNSYPLFGQTFMNATRLTSVSSGLFSGITTGADYMFNSTFSGCTSLASVPAGLFSGITTGADYMFYDTFHGCTSLASVPAGLFSGITNSAEGMFTDTFVGCTSLTGNIDPTTFSGLIGNNSPTENYMWDGTFPSTYSTTCPSGTYQYLTGYEGTDTTNYTKWNGHVACTTNYVTLNKNAADAVDGTTTTGAVNGLVMSQAITPPTRTGYIFMGYYDTSNATGGTKYYNSDGTSAHVWDKTGNQTLYARWEQSKFEITTTNLSAGDHFRFKIGAAGDFYVDCGDGGTLSGYGVAANSVTENHIYNATAVNVNNAYGDDRLYKCNYSTGGEKHIRFGGTATAYFDSGTAPAITFGSATGTGTSAMTANKVASVSGNLSTMFPIINGAAPHFYGLFREATNLTSVDANLFSGYTNIVSNYMFALVFSGCTSLSSVSAGLFSGITGSTQALFAKTFEDCTSLTSVPAGLFSGITTGAQQMFLDTFSGCTSLASVPAGLFSGITTGAPEMFSGTFSGCTSLASVPAGLFSGITGEANGMFKQTFNGCTSLTGNIDPTTFSGLIGNNSPTATDMWNSTFPSTYSTTCPSGTYQYLTGYEGTDTTNYTKWNGHVACTTNYVTLNKNANDAVDGTTTTGAVNGLVMSQAITPPTRTDYIFMGYYDTSNATGGTKYYNADGTSAHTWDKTGNQTLYARWEQSKFEITTTNLSTGDQFKFSMNAAGNFYVDCGEDGTLEQISGVGTTVSDNIITRTTATIFSDAGYYHCTYATGGVKTIKFGGEATGYRTDNAAMAIGFTDALWSTYGYGTPTEIASISGSFIDIFPVINGVAPSFQRTFKGATNLGSIPAALFSGYTNTTTPRMFSRTFDGCSSLTTIPATLFSNITGNPERLFESTFANCTSLTSIPAGLFAGVNGSAERLFYGTFDGCTSLTGNIDPTTFSGLIDNNSPTATNMWTSTFPSTYSTTCPSGTYQYLTGYEGTDTTNYTKWNGHVACTTNYVTLNKNANDAVNGTTTAGVVNGLRMSEPITRPTRSGYIFTGYYDTSNATGGTKYYNSDGTSAHVWDKTGGRQEILYARWEQSKFEITTSVLSTAPYEIHFNMSATGTFIVDCGDGGVLKVGENVNTPKAGTQNTIDDNIIVRNNTEKTEYFCVYTTGGVKNIKFSGLATGYNSGIDIPAISFYSEEKPVYTASNIVSLSGSLSDIFPYLPKQGAIPRFVETFRGGGFTSIPAGLFSGYTSAVSYMFDSTFLGCTSLSSIPEGLFSNITNSAPDLFKDTFNTCTSLIAIPPRLFAGITTAATEMFMGTFSHASGLSGGYIPPSTFAGLINNNSPTATYMWSKTFESTGLTTCPRDMAQYITGYESEWNSNISCGYLVLYHCDDDTSDTKGGSNDVAGFGMPFTPETDHFCKNVGYTFNGWAVSGTNDLKPGGIPFTWDYKEAKTFSAQWTPNTATCTAGQYYRASDAICASCAVGSYCPSANTYTYNGNDQGLVACPAADNNHVRTTYPSDYYNPTLVSINMGTRTGLTDVSQCTVRYVFNNTRGTFAVDNTYYDTTTEKYDLNPQNKYYRNINQGYYGNTKYYTDANCNTSTEVTRYQLYQEATQCPSGSYCPGHNATSVLCTDGPYNDTIGISVCADNTYSDAGASACTACNTVNGYTNSGSTTEAHAGVSSCTVTCQPGQCISVANGACTNVGMTGWSAGGFVSQGQTLACNQCPSGLVTSGLGEGANEAGDCGRLLHFGDYSLYLRSVPKTTPALNVDIDRDGTADLYGNMYPVSTMNGHLHMNYSNSSYVVCDETNMSCIPIEQKKSDNNDDDKEEKQTKELIEEKIGKKN